MSLWVKAQCCVQKIQKWLLLRSSQSVESDFFFFETSSPNIEALAGTPKVDLSGLKFTVILLPLPPDCWTYMACVTTASTGLTFSGQLRYPVYLIKLFFEQTVGWYREWCPERLQVEPGKMDQQVRASGMQVKDLRSGCQHWVISWVWDCSCPHLETPELHAIAVNL